MTAKLTDLLVRDADEARRRSRSFTISGSTLGVKAEVAVVGEGDDAFIWIGELGGHCYGILNAEDLGRLVNLFRQATEAPLQIQSDALIDAGWAYTGDFPHRWSDPRGPYDEDNLLPIREAWKIEQERQASLQPI